MELGKAISKMNAILNQLSDDDRLMALYVVAGPTDPTAAERMRRYRERQKSLRNAQEIPLRNAVTSHATSPTEPTASHTVTNRTRVLSTSEYSPAFLEFWKYYPKRVGKGAAFLCWKRSGCEEVSEVVLKAVREQTAYLEREGGQFIPLPATWLNQRRWEDDPPATSELSKKGGETAQNMKRFVERHRDEI